MLRQNLTLALRSFNRHRISFLINLVGLSTGLACAMFIYLWVSNELAVDKFHEKDQQLFQVMSTSNFPDGLKTEEGTSAFLAETLAKEIPEIEYAVPTTPDNWFKKFTISSADKDVSAKGQFVGNDYFNIFSYPLIQGNSTNILSDKNSIVVSEQLAITLFKSTENAVGKAIDWKWFNLKRQCIVSGVFKNIPSASTVQFDFVLPFDSWKDIVPMPTDIKGGPFYTFIMLRKDTDFTRISSKIKNFIARKHNNSNISLSIRPYSDRYLYNEYNNGVLTGGRIEYIKLFIIIAILVVSISAINFTNLTTARASIRLKELGIKKTIGASNINMILQYLGESMLITFISLVIALGIVFVMLPYLNETTGSHILMNFNLTSAASILAITIFTGLLAGAYPALYLTKFKPVEILTGKIHTPIQDLWARKGLVLFQFTVSLIFIVSVWVVYKQVTLIQTKHVGYDRNHVIYFEMEGRVSENRDVFISELKKVPGVINASSIQQSIISPAYSPVPGVRWDDKNEDDEIRFAQLPVNYNMLEVLNIEMSSGRTFSKTFDTDIDGIIFNEEAIKVMDIPDPLGKVITIWGDKKKIIGVAKNFNFQSLHEKIKPMFFRLAPDETMLVMVRIDKTQEKTAIRNIKHFYEHYNAGFSFDFTFLDQDYQAQYTSENQVAELSKYFALVAVMVSCLGLLGLASFTAARRTKEIGIRKIFGATKFGLVYLLSAEFIPTIVLSIAIALPTSYLITQYWLSGFAFKTELSWWPFISSSVLILLLAGLTISTQVFKIASASPTTSLKN